MEDHVMSDDFPTFNSWNSVGKWMAPTLGAEPASQDRVVWKASQGPCEALNHLIKEAAARPISQRPRNTLSTTISTAQRSSAGSSASTSSASSTSSHRRLRPRGTSATPSSKELTDLIANVSHQVTENAKVKKKYLERQKSKQDGGESTASKQSKRRAISRKLSEELTDRTNVGTRRSNSRAKAKENFPADVQMQSPATRDDAEANSMCIVSANDSQPYIPSTHKQTNQPPVMTPPSDSRSQNHSSSLTSSFDSLFDSSLSAQSSPDQSMEATTSSYAPAAPTTPSIHNLPTVAKPPAPSQQWRASQHAMPRSTPPPLGMRRAHTTGSTSGLVPKGLPTKQNGFKTPFARVPAAGVVNALTDALPANPTRPPASNQPAGRGRTATAPSRPPANTHCQSRPPPRDPTPPAADADSSFGEMPFDLTEIDEAMSKYD